MVSCNRVTASMQCKLFQWKKGSTRSPQVRLCYLVCPPCQQHLQLMFLQLHLQLLFHCALYLLEARRGFVQPAAAIKRAYTQNVSANSAESTAWQLVDAH